MPAVTKLPIQLSYFIADITTALLSYDRMRWHRSRSGQLGLYEAATAPVAAPATILGTLEQPHQVNGKTLSLRIGGTSTINITFADPDPVTTAQVVSAINGATMLVVASDAGGYLRLTTAATGSGASIEILDSAAAPYLGLYGDAVGIDVDTIIVGGTHEYFYTDQNSDEDFWYRIELINSSTLTSTGLSVPFQANASSRVPVSYTIACYIRLAGLTGLAMEGRRITFHNAFVPNTVTTPSLRWGLFRHYAEMITDRNGYAEIRLIRGMTVDFVVDGTDFVRRIVVPTTGDAVDLLSPALSAEDEFGIQEANVDFAVRTS